VFVINIVFALVLDLIMYNVFLQDGRRPLTFAATNNRVPALQFLLENGADPNLPNRVCFLFSSLGFVMVHPLTLLPLHSLQNGWTALYIAAAKGYLEAANTLLAFLRSPSDVNVRNTVSCIYVLVVTLLL